MTARSPLTLTVALVLLTQCQAFAQNPSPDKVAPVDSLLGRLTEAKHVKLSTERGDQEFILHLIAPAQRDKMAAEAKAYKDYSKVFEEKILAAREEAAVERARARERRFTSPQEAFANPNLNPNSSAAEQAIRKERARLFPSSPWSEADSYYDVMRVGEDYVELRSIGYTRITRLIPLHKIGQVVIAPPMDETEETDKKEAPPEKKAEPKNSES